MKNQIHPEQLNDEIYMGNVRYEDRFLPRTSKRIQNNSKWKTSRYGNQAIDSDGNTLSKINKLLPWFIKISEIESEIIKLKENPEHNSSVIEGFEKMIKTKSIFC